MKYFLLYYYNYYYTVSVVVNFYRNSPSGYLLSKLFIYINRDNLDDYIDYTEARRGAGAQSVTVKPTGCGFDPHSRR